MTNFLDTRTHTKSMHTHAYTVYTRHAHTHKQTPVDAKLTTYFLDGSDGQA